MGWVLTIVYYIKKKSWFIIYIVIFRRALFASQQRYGSKLCTPKYQVQCMRRERVRTSLMMTSLIFQTISVTFQLKINES